MTLQEIIGIVLIFVGVFFSAIGTLGVIRLPDVYTRLHASGKVSTLGLIGLLSGTAVLMPQTTIKMLVLALFMVITAPVASHAIASAAYHLGIKPKAQRDDLAHRRGTPTPVVNGE